MDRRVKYTKQVLSQSLIHFLEQKEITKITVTEICKEADINRSTYYAYYTDPYDQLAKLKSGLLGEMASFTVKIDTQKIPQDQIQYMVLKSMLDYAETKKNVFRILLDKSGDHHLREELLSILGEKAFGSEIMKCKNQDERDLLLRYAANGCFGLFYHWLMTDEDSTEKIARMMAGFTKKLLTE